MRVHSATLAGGPINQDRLLVTNDMAIVLDGASSAEPYAVDTGKYAETLGAAIAGKLSRDPALPIPEAVAAGIRHTAKTLALTAGYSPSSTVTVLRAKPGEVDLYTLGDSPIRYHAAGSDHLLTDDRLSSVAIAERERYRMRLREGHGYDAGHRAALLALQQAQSRARNTEGGYWIAETDPAAAYHGYSRTISSDVISWAVLATDGASTTIDYLQLSWPDVAALNSRHLANMLSRLHQWEQNHDPNGYHLARAKRHDDKTIAAITDLLKK